MKRFRFRLLRSAAPALAFCSLILPATAATLPELVNQVLSQHPDIQTSRSLLHAAEEQVKQARSNYYPTVGVDALAMDSTDTQFGVPLDRTTQRTDAYLRWNLFRGRGDRQGIRSAEYSREAADADLAETHEQVALEVSETYLELLRLRRQLALGDEYRADLLRLSEVVRKREQAGRIPTADLDQVRVSLIQAEAQQAQLRGQVRGTEQRMRLLIGGDAGELSEPVLDDSAAGLGKDALLEQVQAGNRRVRAAVERASARGEEVGLAESRLFPTLDLELRKRLATAINPVLVTDTRSSTQFQLSYQVPLGGANFSKKREAVERKFAAQAAAESELLRARTEIGLRWEAWQEVRKIAPELVERVDASNKVVSAFDLQFDAGRRSLTDLISARGDRNRAMADVIDNRADQAVACARVLSLLGGLRQSLSSASAAPLRASAEGAAALAPIQAPPAPFAQQPAPAAPAIVVPPSQPAPTAVPQVATPEEVQLIQRTQQWAAAWSARNYDAYMAFYAPQFRPVEGISHKTWQRHRRERLAKPGAIAVTLDALKVKFPTPDTATVEFRQTYRAADYQDEMRKVLWWQRIDGNWLITRESKIP